MSETLITCPGCKIPNFTPKGLKSHKCKGPKPVSAVVVPAPAAILGDARKALDKLREVIAKYEETFHNNTLGPRLQIGLAALKAYQAFAITDKAKKGQGRKAKNQVTRDVITPGGFEGWLLTEASWLKKPTAYKYMTAVRGLGLDHTATEKQVAAALKLLLRKGPVSLASLCAAAVDPLRIKDKEDDESGVQTEFEFLRDGLADFRKQADALLALKADLHKHPDMERVASARIYGLLVEITGSHWKPSDEPDDLASVNPDSIEL